MSEPFIAGIFTAAMKDIICMTVLTVLAAEDLKRKYVSGSLLVILAAAGAADSFLKGRMPEEMILSLLPGILLLALSLLSGERIGTGDALCLTALGFGMEPEEIMEIFCTGFLAAGVYSAAVVIKKGRRGADESFAFIPFVLCTFAVDRILRVL